jgi:hypothetical protein
MQMDKVIHNANTEIMAMQTKMSGKSMEILSV